MIDIDQEKYDIFKKNNHNFSLLMNKFIFQNDNFKNFFVSQEKSNYEFYCFLSKNSKDIFSITQIGCCGGYFLGTYLCFNNQIEEITVASTKNNNNQILRLTKNNLLNFKNVKKNYSTEIDNSFLKKEIISDILIIFDNIFILDYIDDILLCFLNNKSIKYLILDNLKDDLNFENKIKNFCIIKSISFQKFKKRNDIIILRK